MVKMVTIKNDKLLKHKVRTHHKIHEKKQDTTNTEETNLVKREKLTPETIQEIEKNIQTLNKYLNKIEKEFNENNLEKEDYIKIKIKIEKAKKQYNKIIENNEINTKTLETLEIKQKETQELEEEIKNILYHQYLKTTFQQLRKDYDYFEENLEYYIEVYEKEDNYTEMQNKLIEKALSTLNNLNTLYENKCLNLETYEKFNFLINKSIKKLKTINEPSQFNNKILKHLKRVYSKAYTEIDEKI
jgi:small-conductance mechanosensitive channel